MCEAPCNWTHYEVYTQSVNSLRAHVLFVLTWDARAIQCIEQNKHDLARFRIVLRAQQIMMHWKLYGSLGGLASTFRLKNAQKFYLFFANYFFLFFWCKVVKVNYAMDMHYTHTHTIMQAIMWCSNFNHCKHCSCDQNLFIWTFGVEYWNMRFYTLWPEPLWVHEWRSRNINLKMFAFYRNRKTITIYSRAFIAHVFSCRGR